MQDRKTNPESRRGRWLAIAIAAAVVVAGGIFLVSAMAEEKVEPDAESAEAAKDSEEKNEDEKAPVPVSLAEVEAGPISAYLTASANLVAENEVMVLAETDGRVERLNTDEGKQVGGGQVLATLVHDDQEIARSKARLKETNARLAFERAERLVGQELISREAYDQEAMDYEIARQELAEAEWKLAKSVIRSPFAGSVTERIVQAGQNVRAGDELFKITDFDPLIARIFVPEKDVIGLAPGQPVRVSLSAVADVTFEARIRQISSVVDTATGTVKVTIEARRPPAEVRPGTFVTIDIVRETREGAIKLPREAVVRELQKAHVFVAEEGVAKRRAVTLGLEEGPWVEAMTGVEAGEQVIVAGQGALKEGAAVKTLDPAGDETTAAEDSRS